MITFMVIVTCLLLNLQAYIHPVLALLIVIVTGLFLIRAGYILTTVCLMPEHQAVHTVTLVTLDLHLLYPAGYIIAVTVLCPDHQWFLTDTVGNH
jgi:hypothetical protein